MDSAREVVAAYHPRELELFDQVVAEYRIDPRRVLGRTPLRAPVGAGAELTVMATYVMWVMTFLFGAVTTRVVDRAADAVVDAAIGKLGPAIREKLAALLRHRIDRHSAGESVSAAPESVPAHGEKTAPSLSSAQEHELAEILVDHLTSSGLAEADACQLAEDVIDWLRPPGHESDESDQAPKA
ncbi:hypothetical protein ACFFWE_14275 [Sphaerisporangium melleum]|uniref:hypothetical protein n=1 Tax=Sphaerisporangium melleum TaxID=321316 RepID=UPI001667DD0A|nr:hypothetical protein [Sphaerisporangium melleum]